jgi:hypothetical protein
LNWSFTSSFLGSKVFLSPFFSNIVIYLT